MYVKIFLLSLAAVALAQNNPQASSNAQGPSNCPCGALQTCLQAKKTALLNCQLNCASQAGNASACITAKVNSFQNLSPSPMGACVFTGGNGVCTASARFARQSGVGSGAGVGGVGHWHGAGDQEHDQNSALKPYRECVEACEKQNQPQKPNWSGQEGQQGGQHGGGQGGNGGRREGSRALRMFEMAIHRCAEETSPPCIVNRDTAKPAIETCHSQSQNPGDPWKSIEQTYCQCLNTALNKNPPSPCNF